MTLKQLEANLKKRHARERRFRLYGMGTIFVVLLILGGMLAGLTWNGVSVLWKPFVKVEVTFDPSVVQLNPTQVEESLRAVNYRQLIYASLIESYPQLIKGLTRSQILQLISPGAELYLYRKLKQDPGLVGKKQTFWLLGSDDVDFFLKHKKLRRIDESNRRVNNQQVIVIDQLAADKKLIRRFNWMFFTSGDSRSPELAGIYGALIGSIYTILVTLLLAVPLGIGAAIYLEEFAPDTRMIRFFELNINNLASVPSIIFGLLGLAVFLNVLHLPRSSALVGGITLALMTLPTIIIASRSSLQTVPNAIRRAAEGLGASSVQVVFHHVVPLALPGMITGTILGMARALGESAALLMIGMVAFIVEAPSSVTDPSTALPVQIFNWARNPERGFADHTAAAIIVLLIVLMAMNWGAIVIRKRFEHRW